MSMVTQVDAYLDHRRALGFQLRSSGYQLYRFARFADACDHQGPLTLALALRWAKASPGATLVSQARRLALLRPFAQYLLAFDPATEIPPPGLLGPLHQRRCPYIYSGDEIQALLAGAAELPPANGLRPQTMQTLFGLLAATGLRVSEALALACTDIDWPAACLTVRETKYAQSRHVPLHSSTITALQRYREKSHGYRQRADGGVFFYHRSGASAGLSPRLLRLCRHPPPAGLAGQRTTARAAHS